MIIIIGIGITCAMHRRKTLPLKINFFFYDKDLFCFNVSFLFISQFRATFLAFAQNVINIVDVINS